ncbi:MAG TPA: 16S rRNA (guanine(527)-N(7))-methyltransferase RsmG [Puia sp.]|nr:16S rRNA (guanine(527)-N(7))-methyltransferase RsmG [Puia sp.]
MEKAPQNLELITKYFSHLTPTQLRQLSDLDSLYHEWNNKINVISRKDISSLYEKHVLHSLSIAAVFDFQKGMRVIDIGTGGGFPGIPLAIFFPETDFHLVDSIGKKLKVVEVVASVIGLSNITIQQIRAEEIKDKKFDVAVSRAVAPLKDLCRWTKPLLRYNKQEPKEGDRGEMKKNADKKLANPNGLICLKGGDLAQEIAESTCRPGLTEISEIFAEAYFKEKFLVHIPFQGM